MEGFLEVDLSHFGINTARGFINLDTDVSIDQRNKMLEAINDCLESFYKSKDDPHLNEMVLNKTPKKYDLFYLAVNEYCKCNVLWLRTARNITKYPNDFFKGKKQVKKIRALLAYAIHFKNTLEQKANEITDLIKISEATSPVSEKVYKADIYFSQKYVKDLIDKSYLTLMEERYKDTSVAAYTTPYHEERVKCHVYKTPEDMLTNESVINNLNSWKNLLKQSNKNTVIAAADWYINFAQRDFLKNQLIKIFSAFENGATVNICESTTSSYIHHYTYVSILIDALKMSKKKLKINLTIIEAFAFPLIQIGAVENEIRNGKIAEFEYPRQNMIPAFSVRKNFVDFIRTEFDIAFYVKHFSEPIVIDYDISNAFSNELEQLHFDIITEHFLLNYTRFSEQEYPIAIRTIRENYKRFAKGKLHLLCACGGHILKVCPDYFMITEKVGFREIANNRIWDIFDENLSKLSNKKKGDKLIPKTNLVHWVYEHS